MKTADASEYVGRTSDLLAFAGDGSAALPQSHDLAADGGGYVVTGPRKVAQRFLYLLLNRKGTLRYAPSVGTSFMEGAVRGRWRTGRDVAASFSASMLDLRRQMTAAESASDPDDERFAGATLTGVSLSGDVASVSITLTLGSGEAVKVTAPIAVPVR